MKRIVVEIEYDCPDVDTLMHAIFVNTKEIRSIVQMTNDGIGGMDALESTRISELPTDKS